MARRRREVIEDQDRRFRPVRVVAMTATAGLSGAILFNAFFGQPISGHDQAGQLSAAPGGATTRLDVSVSSPAQTTIQIKYDPMVEEAQRELQNAGYYRGAVDGVVGRRTRDAISAYQQANGLEVTGQPSQDLIDHIRYTRQIAEAALFTGSVDADPEAQARAQVRRVQTGLAELAYYQGEITGEMGRDTHAAIQQFEHDRGLAESGEISDRLMQELAKLSGQTSAAQ